MLEKRKYLSRVASLAIAAIVGLVTMFGIMSSDVSAASKPYKPTITTIKSLDYNQTYVRWSTSKYAKKYEVYRRASGATKYVKVATVSGKKSFTDTKVVTGTKYYYKVRGVNESTKGKFSAVKFTVPKMKKNSITAISSAELSVKLKYSGVNGAQGYQVYRGSTEEGKYSHVGKYGKNIRVVNDKKVKTYTGYYYKVRAYRVVNGKYVYSPFSNPVYVKTKNHSYTHKVVAPTCTEKGYTYHECTGCKKNYKDAYKTVLGHDYNGIVSVGVAPTCTEKGYNVVQCTRCTSTSEVVIDELGHDFVNGTEVARVEPTCMNEGVRTVKCASCDAVSKEMLPTKGHEFGIVRDVEPTCTSQGYSEYKCVTSGCTEVKRDHYVPALGHNWVIEEGDNGVYWDVCDRHGCTSEPRVHEHRMEKVYREKTEDDLRAGYYEYTTVEYYGCLECGGQLLTDEEVILTKDSDPALLAQYQDAHKEYHKPDGVTPTFGTVVVEKTEPVFISQDGGKILEGELCTVEGCDYFVAHNHSYTTPVEVPTSEYQLVSTDVQYINKQLCQYCDNCGDYAVYRSGSGFGSAPNHVYVHAMRRQTEGTGTDFVYHVGENVCKYRSVPVIADVHMCSTEGCDCIE